MSLCFGVKAYFDLSIILIYAQILCDAFGVQIEIYGPLVLLAAAAGLCHALRGRGKWVWLPLVAVPCCLLLLPGWAGALVLLVPAAYLAVTVKRRLFEIDYSTCADNVRRGMTMLLPIPLIGMLFGVFGAGDALAKHALPAAVVCLSCGVWLLRVLRHEREMLSRPRFILLNAGVLALVLGAVALVSTPAVLGAIKTALGFVYQKLIVPPLMLLGYLAAGLMWLLSRLFSGIQLNRQGMEMEGEMDGVQEPLFGDAAVMETPELLKAVLATLFIALCILVAWRVVRRMMGSSRAPAGETSVVKTRSLGELSHREERPPLLRPRESRAAVRFSYRRFLVLCRRVGISLFNGATSETVANWAEEFWQGAPVRRLRALYIHARYSPGEVSREMADEAGELVKQLKKEMPRSPK